MWETRLILFPSCASWVIQFKMIFFSCLLHRLYFWLPSQFGWVYCSMDSFKYASQSLSCFFITNRNRDCPTYQTIINHLLTIVNHYLAQYINWDPKQEGTKQTPVCGWCICWISLACLTHVSRHTIANCNLSKRPSQLRTEKTLPRTKHSGCNSTRMKIRDMLSHRRPSGIYFASIWFVPVLSCFQDVRPQAVYLHFLDPTVSHRDPACFTEHVKAWVCIPGSWNGRKISVKWSFTDPRLGRGDSRISRMEFGGITPEPSRAYDVSFDLGNPSL